MVAITELQPCAMLANGPPWTKAGAALERLHEVGLERVAEQHGHRAVRLEIARRVTGLLVAGVADDDAAEPLA